MNRPAETKDEVFQWARRNDGQDPTPRLEAFREAYAEDDNIWWMCGSGHHQNLFEAACDQADKLEDALREAMGELADARAMRWGPAK